MFSLKAAAVAVSLWFLRANADNTTINAGNVVLPIVDLGYVRHQAIQYNVSRRLPSPSLLSGTESSLRLPVTTTTSRTSLSPLLPWAIFVSALPRHHSVSLTFRMAPWPSSVRKASQHGLPSAPPSSLPFSLPTLL